MGRTQQNKKRRGWIWQYRSLILSFLLLFFCLEGLALKKAISNKQKNKTKTSLYKKKQSAGKKDSKRRVSIKKIKSKKISVKNIGYKIPYIKTGSLFGKMKLKKDDIIQSIEKQSTHSKKQIYQILSSLLKKKKKFSLSIIRKKKKFLISYKIIPFKTKQKIIISKVKEIKTYTASIKKKKRRKKRRLASVSNKKTSKRKTNKATTTPNKKTSKTKQTLVPKKYKPHLQRAYVLTLNSFVYKQPDFDSPQLYPIPVGKQILISKKIFRPRHNFGSFYKVFLFHDKKIIGYISEAEVAPEFLKKNDEYKINPAFKLAKKQMKNDKVLDIDLIDKANKQRQKKESPKNSSKKNKNRYVGLSVGGILKYSKNPQENVLLGVRLSGYNLLISSLNMDFNFNFTPSDFKFVHFDILTAYPILKSTPYYLFIMGGLKFDINKRISEPMKQLNPGFSGALSLVIPLNQKLIWRTDAKIEYGLSDQSLTPSFLSSLQIAF